MSLNGDSGDVCLYSDEMPWKTIGTPGAIKHVRDGGSIFKIAPSFKRGNATYQYGIQTRTGVRYLMSEYVKKGVDREVGGFLLR